MKLGDKNANFSKIIANNRYKRNSICSIKVGGRVLEEPAQIRATVVDYFRNIFNENLSNRPKFCGSINRKLSSTQSTALEKKFLKAPGPDGFNFSFIHKKKKEKKKGDRL